MLGLAKPAHILQPHSCGVRDVVHMTAIACMQAQELGPAHGNGAPQQRTVSQSAKV